MEKTGCASVFPAWKNRACLKIANRITAGLISAALIIGAALTMRIETAARLLGYPALALVMFVLATGLGVSLVLVAVLSDRHVSRYRPRKR